MEVVKRVKLQVSVHSHEALFFFKLDKQKKVKFCMMEKLTNYISSVRSRDLALLHSSFFLLLNLTQN